MDIAVKIEGEMYLADTSNPIHIAIPLRNGIDHQPNAFGAPPFEAWPLTDGSFVGSLEKGSPVNFYNIRINPHGNGTHTECLGHIYEGDHSIHRLLTDSMVPARVISVYPTRNDAGNRMITPDSLDAADWGGVEAIVIRTMPNDESKQHRKYTSTDPPFFAPETIELIVERGVKHLLTDLPSIDPERDGGALLAHKTFWSLPKNPAYDRTITELIFVSNNVADGLYLLNIQVAPLELDVSPSRPILYKLRKTT